MSVDILQDRIRKLKNPSMLELLMAPEDIPEQLLQEEGTFVRACGRFCRELLERLKDQVPGVRFSFGRYALMGPEGLVLLKELLVLARSLGYYTALDAPGILSPAEARITAESLLGEESAFPCDGLIFSGFLGSDNIKPFVPYCKKQDKDIFVVVRTANKSGSELQDLLAGSRVVHVAAADLVNRYTPGTVGRRGYARVGIMAGASSYESIRILRQNYPQLFMVLDGADYPNANAKNCSFAFDQFGHGAVACIGESVTCAWKAEGEGDWLDKAEAGAERMKKNLTRYVTIL